MFYLERFTKNIGNQISKKISKYNLVFEHPNYWEAVNEIVDGELLISFIKDKDNFKAWIPIIIKKFNNLTLANSLPYYGSHGGPFGPDKEIYLELINKTYTYLKELDVDSYFLSLGLDNEFIVENLNFLNKKIIVDSRIGQLTKLPKYSDSIKENLFNIFHTKTRNAIRKGLALDKVDIHLADDYELREIIYLHQENIKKLGGLPKEIDHFNKLIKKSKNGFKVRAKVAYINGDIAAGLIGLLNNNTYEYFTPALKEEFRDSQILSRVIFQEMEYASSLSIDNWNWGGTWESQEGVYRFKKRWGAKDLKYYYLLFEKNDKIKKYFSAGNKDLFKYFYKYKF